MNSVPLSLGGALEKTPFDKTWDKKCRSSLEKTALEDAFQREIQDAFSGFAITLTCGNPDHSAAVGSFRERLKTLRIALDLALKEIE